VWLIIARLAVGAVLAVGAATGLITIEPTPESVAQVERAVAAQRCHACMRHADGWEGRAECKRTVCSPENADGAPSTQRP